MTTLLLILALMLLGCITDEVGDAVVTATNEQERRTGATHSGGEYGFDGHHPRIPESQQAGEARILTVGTNPAS